MNLRLTDAALEILHGPDRCRMCGGRGWISCRDPLYPDEHIDVRCPACVDQARPFHHDHAY